MRISDWSSDVCSSDLHCSTVFIVCSKASEEQLKDINGKMMARKKKIAEMQQAMMQQAEAQQVAARQQQQAMLQQAQIGRASCRERVCQYVEISVVGGELKKKQ